MIEHPWTAGWTARVVGARQRASKVAAAPVVAVALGLCWTATYLLGGAGLVVQHWFYLPIFLAAVRFGYRGTALTALLAGMLAGPLMPLYVRGGQAQPPSLWIPRAVFFLVIGLFVAGLIARLQAFLVRDLEVASQERDLALRKAAVIATVTHEFRTPLTVIRGVSKTLEAQGLVKKEGLALLAGLNGAGERLEDLVDAVLGVVEGSESVTEPKRAPVVLRDVCADVVGRLGRLQAAARVKITVDPEAEIIVADALLVGHLLRHIIENALKFSPSNTPVGVSVAKLGGGVEVRVSDRGSGIDERILAGVRDPFGRRDQYLTRSSSGLGIGLFAATRIAEVLEGSLTLQPRAGGGTEAVIYIPSADRKESMGLETGVPWDAPAQHRSTAQHTTPSVAET